MWSSSDLGVRAEVAFSELNPLLIDLFDVLIRTIQTKESNPRGYPIRNVGHYLTE